MHFAETVLPWFLPGTAAFVVLGLALCRCLARTLDTRPFVAWLLVAGLGIIVSATLTPVRGVFETAATGPGTCDMSDIGLIPLRELLQLNERSLNVLLFLPLGVALGLLPRSRTTAILVMAAVVLPFAIEATQLVAPILGRGCQGADVIDNLTGLALGLAAGTLFSWLLSALRRPAP